MRIAVWGCGAIGGIIMFTEVITERKRAKNNVATSNSPFSKRAMIERPI